MAARVKTTCSHPKVHTVQHLQISLGIPPVRDSNYAMPTKFDHLPFGYPKDKPQSELVNKLISYSLECQKECQIVANCAFPTFVMHRCLKAAGVPNRVATGIRYMTGDAKPHCWLVIHGVNVDNTYHKELCAYALRNLKENALTCYREEPYSFPHPSEAGSEVDTPYDEFTRVVSMWRIDYFKNNPDRAIALCINRQMGYNYYFSMIRFVDEVSGNPIQGIDPKVRHMCWGCNKYPRAGEPFIAHLVQPLKSELKDPVGVNGSVQSWKFPQCSRCMVASYCSVQCQTRDWEAQHRSMCVSREHNELPPLGSHF